MLNSQVSDMKNKMDAKVRECEKLKDELKKKDKTFEDKLNLANCKYFWQCIHNMIHLNE